MEPLIFLIRQFLSETGMPRTVFGRLAVNDPRLVDDLINGREPRQRTRMRVENFIAAQRQVRR